MDNNYLSYLCILYFVYRMPSSINMYTSIERYLSVHTEVQENAFNNKFGLLFCFYLVVCC